MAASKPILGVLESGSEIRCIVEDTKDGLCCEPGEYDKVEEKDVLIAILATFYVTHAFDPTWMFCETMGLCQGCAV